MRRLFALALLLIVTTSSASLQQGRANVRQGPDGDRPGRPPGPKIDGHSRVVVDGARNPEKISEESVITKALALWSIPPGATEQDERKLRALTGRMNLRPSDFQLLRIELISAHPQFNAARNTLTHSEDASAARGNMLALQQVGMQTYGRLIEVMSKDGRKRLRDHIDYLKRRTKVVAKDPPPPLKK